MEVRPVYGVYDVRGVYRLWPELYQQWNAGENARTVSWSIVMVFSAVVVMGNLVIIVMGNFAIIFMGNLAIIVMANFAIIVTVMGHLASIATGNYLY